MEGLCPVAKAARWTGEVRRVDPHALAALLLPVAGVRTIATIGKSQGIGKKGIRWQHRWYIHADLAEHVGKAVFCRVDEADLGRLYVYVDDAVLCLAENPAMTGISQAEVAAVAKAKQKKAMTAHTKELRRIKKEVGTNAAQEVLRARAEASGKLIEFPRAGTPYSTPALEAGAAAVAAQAPRVAREETPEEAAGRTHLAARIAARAQAAARVPETDQERYLRWVRMEAEIAAGVTFTHDLMAWWTDYPNTAEGKVQKKMAQVYPKLYAVGAHPGVS